MHCCRTPTQDKGMSFQTRRSLSPTLSTDPRLRPDSGRQRSGERQMTNDDQYAWHAWRYKASARLGRRSPKGSDPQCVGKRLGAQRDRLADDLGPNAMGASLFDIGASPMDPHRSRRGRWLISQPVRDWLCTLGAHPAPWEALIVRCFTRGDGDPLGCSSHLGRFQVEVRRGASRLDS